MKTSYGAGILTLLLCTGFQSSGFATDQKADVDAAATLLGDFKRWEISGGDSGTTRCAAKMNIAVAGARGPWQLCVKTGASKECRWLDTTDASASFNSYSGLGSLGTGDTHCPSGLGKLGGLPGDGLGELGGSEGQGGGLGPLSGPQSSEDGLGPLGVSGHSDTYEGFLVFVQNHPAGQACIVRNAEGIESNENISVACYDIAY